MYKNHVISTKSELLTSGFRIPSRPDHNGADFVDTKRQEATTKGVDIIAIADGKIVEVINGNLVGWTVAISHESKILSRYQHMRNNSVVLKVGDTVKKGQKLGVMGNTGECYSSNINIPPEYRGTHLHFGIKENSTAYNNGIWVDPMLYLNGTKIIGGTTSSLASQTESSEAMTNDNLQANDKVKINATATVYATGLNIPAYVKNNTYTIQQINNNKVLLKEIASWVLIKDLTLISASTQTSATKPTQSNVNLKPGDKVKVVQGAKSYTGTTLALFVYNNIYEIAQLSGDRATIGIRNKTTNIIDITAAMNIKDLIKI